MRHTTALMSGPDSYWDEDSVSEAYVEALKSSARISLYSPGRGAVTTALDNTISLAQRLIAYADVLPKTERDALVLWAGGEAYGWNSSRREHLRQLGWGNPSTLYRRRKRACSEIARMLNRDKVARLTL